MSAQSLICKDCNLLLRSVKEAEVRGLSWTRLRSRDHESNVTQGPMT